MQVSQRSLPETQLKEMRIPTNLTPEILGKWMNCLISQRFIKYYYFAPSESTRDTGINIAKLRRQLCSLPMQIFPSNIAMHFLEC